VNSFSNAEDTAAKLMASLPSDLAGEVVRIPTFGSESDCRFFFPERSLAFFEELAAHLDSSVRLRNGRTEGRQMSVQNYFLFLHKRDEDTPAKRQKYVESRIGLVATINED
jgi:hypothetical protein